MRAKASGQSSLLLLDIVDILNTLNISYAVIGAFAASFYGAVRASMDVDAVISEISEKDLKALLSVCKEQGLKVKHHRGDMADPIAAVINIRDRFKNRIDLIIGIRGMERGVFSRAVNTTFAGSKIRMVGLEDFIAMKIFAGSAKDINDVQGVLKVSYAKLNIPRLKELTSHYGRRMLAQLELLLKDSLH